MEMANRTGIWIPMRHSMSHSQAGRTAYKKAPTGTTVEVAGGTILPVDGFGTVEVNLDQPGTTTKPVKIVSAAHVPGLSRNLLSTRKAVEQWGKPLVYYKIKVVLRLLGEDSLVFNFCPHKGSFSATVARRTPSQGAALALTAKTAEAIRVEKTGQWGPAQMSDGARVKRRRWRWQQKRLRRLEQRRVSGGPAQM